MTLRLFAHPRCALAALLLALAACGSSTSRGEEPDADTEEDAGEIQGSEHPPIYVTLNAHGHNYGFAAQAANAANWLDLKRDRYDQHKAEIVWLAQTAEEYGARYSFQLNGEYSRDARVLYDDTRHIRDLMAAGHSVGLHFHPYSYSGADEYWQEHPNAQITPSIQELIWRSQIDEVVSAKGAAIRRLDPATPLATTEHQDVHRRLVAEYGIDIMGGGEPFTYTEWNHNPHNPYRPAFPDPLLEDPDGSWVTSLSLSQVGLPAPQGKHQVLTTVPQLKRHFLLTYAEWRYAQLAGDGERIWSFGIMTHPDQNATYHEEVREMIRWFSEDMRTRIGPAGQPVLQFATDEEVADAFKAWEQRNPGVSSFNFDWSAHLAGDTQPYPYRLRGLAEGLLDAELVSTLDGLTEQGVEAFELVHRNIDRGPANAEGIRAMTIGSTGWSVYLLWSTEQTTIDFSAHLDGTVYIKDGISGEVTTAPAAALPVGPAPIVVCSSDAYF